MKTFRENFVKIFAKEKSLHKFSRNVDEGFHIGFLTKVLKVFTMGCPKGFRDGVAAPTPKVAEITMKCGRGMYDMHVMSV